MSRRPNPANDRAAQNQQTIKALLKLEGNKICADCKRNKHPRWASWNLGIFVCIRCSGIHRGMGTHISRVKSVDLDSWTDEQLQVVLKWGNSRANKYWEAKLAEGHVPSEAKIENFIRTKYESKRWVMDGPMPDPSTLDAAGDDDVPLNIVQEKAKIERSTSLRTAQAAQQQQAQGSRQQPRNVDLFEVDSIDPPVRPNTADIAQSKPSRTAPPRPAPGPGPGPARQSKQGESLLGLDFFGASQPASSAKPASSASNPTSTSRPDLKQSILSLYASAPKPQPTPQQSHDRQPSLGSMASPYTSQQNAFGGLTDGFGDLNFGSKPATQQPPPKPAASAFAGFGDFNSPPTLHKTTPATAQMTSPPPLSGGGFFDSLPSKPIAQTKAAPQPNRQSSNGLNFSFAQNPVSSPAPAPAPVTSALDLFASDDFSGFASASPAPPPVPPPTKVASPVMASPSSFNSAFNLSAPSAPPVKAAPAPPTSSRPPMVAQSSAAMFDPWGSNTDTYAWGAPAAAPAKAPAAPGIDLGKPPSHITPNDISGGWGSPISSSNKPIQQPMVAADEDFGGWTSASTNPTPTAAPIKTSGGGFTSTSDPFDNPWG